VSLTKRVFDHALASITHLLITRPALRACRRRHLCGSTPYLSVVLTTKLFLPILGFRLLFVFVSLSFSFRIQFDSASSLSAPDVLAPEVPCVHLAMSDHGSTIDELEKQRITFENRHTTPTFSAKDKIRWRKILDNATRPDLSEGRKNIRFRAHTIATTILQSVGPDVLLLVFSLLNQDTLAKLDRETFVNALQAWWKDVPHPLALTNVALQHFATDVSQNAFASVSTEQDCSVVFGRTVYLSRKCNANIL
jgi:hypothetical protein